MRSRSCSTTVFWQSATELKNPDTRRPEEYEMAEINGARLIARSLKQQGVDYMFGVVGFPVIPIASAAQTRSIRSMIKLSFPSLAINFGRRWLS